MLSKRSCALLCASAIVLSGRSAAAVPLWFNHHGRLVDADSRPVTAKLNFTLRFHKKSVDPIVAGKPEDNLVFQQSFEDLQVTDGAYSVLVGPVAFADWDGVDERWMAVEIGSDGEMTPRIQVVSVPWALRADEAGALAGKTLAYFAPAGELLDFKNEVGNTYLKKAGGTVSGPLVIEQAGGSLTVNGPAALQGGATASDLTVDDSLAVGGDALYVTPLGKVGIGTASPGQKLTVAGNVDIASPGTLLVGGQQVVDANRNIVSIGSSSEAHIRASPGADLQLEANGAPTGHLTIATSGNVGIGTTSPGAGIKLDVYNGGSNAFVRAGRGGSMEGAFFIVDGGTSGGASVGYELRLGGTQKGLLRVAEPTVLRVDAMSGVDLALGSGGAEKLRIRASDGNVGIGTESPGQTLDVNGSFRGGGRVRVETDRTIGNAQGATVAVGSFSNDGVGKNIQIHLKNHSTDVIDVHTYEISEVAYLGAQTKWLELPLNRGSVSYAGRAGYAVEVYRPNISDNTLKDPLYVRVRNKAGVGSGNATVQLVIDYDDDSTFTALTAASTIATSFDALTAPAGGAVDGYYGSLEWMFPVTNGPGWNNAGGNGLFVKNNGNVGIGTTSPGSRLHVNGYIQIAAISGSAPASADCNEAAEVGRMVIWSENISSHKICFCPQNLGQGLNWICK